MSGELGIKEKMGEMSRLPSQKRRAIHGVVRTDCWPLILSRAYVKGEGKTCPARHPADARTPAHLWHHCGQWALTASTLRDREIARQPAAAETCLLGSKWPQGALEGTLVPTPGCRADCKLGQRILKHNISNVKYISTLPKVLKKETKNKPDKFKY